MQSDGKNCPVDGGVDDANDDKLSKLLKGRGMLVEMNQFTSPSHEFVYNVFFLLLCHDNYYSRNLSKNVKSTLPQFAIVFLCNLWYNYKHYMIGEIWDNLMRHKLRLGLLLVTLALGVVAGAKIMAYHQPTVSHAQEIGVGPAPVYNNSLTLRIPGKSGKVAYELVFASDFRSAKITVTAEALSSNAAVKILNPSGQVVVSEQTSTQGTEIKFTSAPKTYSVSLGKGYMLDVQGANVQVLSNLDYSLATAFMPSGSSERYVMMTDGLRKSTWSESEGKTALYNLLKNYIVGQIETYKSKLSDAVLNNKNLDVANKTRIVLAYRNLKGVDQEPYREFIKHLQRGGVPEITYKGQRTYTVGDQVDFTKLVSARDGEDGAYAPEQIITKSEVDLSRAGQYTLAYTVGDSDENTVTLKIPITVAEAQIADDAPTTDTQQPPTTPNTTVNSDAEDSASSTVYTVGGGMNIETGSAELIDDSDATVWGEQVEAENTMSSQIITSETATEVSSTTKNTEQQEQSHGISASQIILIVLGIILLFGLVRFIFDHYVR